MFRYGSVLISWRESGYIPVNPSISWSKSSGKPIKSAIGESVLLNLFCKSWHSTTTIGCQRLSLPPCYWEVWLPPYKFTKSLPSRSLTVRPWKVTFPIGKDRLPTTIFQGRAVKLQGCIITNSLGDNHLLVIKPFCDFRSQIGNLATRSEQKTSQLLPQNIIALIDDWGWWALA